jgi:hypothetical protein
MANKSFAKQLVHWLFQALISPAVLLSKTHRHSESFFMSESAERLSNKNYSLSYSIRPQDMCKRNAYSFDVCHKLGIVIQGPIRIEDHFTLNAVRYYRSNYKNVLVIVSTWKNEADKEINEIEKAGAVVVLTEKPSNKGVLNVNLQLASSKAGIEKAKMLGAEYIAKTRSDQLISKINAFQMMIGMLNNFPSFSKNQSNRIIVTSMNYGNLFFPFFMSDFFYFGKTSDIEKLMSIPADNRIPFEMEPKQTRKSYSEKEYPPEIFILKSYLKSIGEPTDVTVKDYWQDMKNCFICCDWKMLGLIWPKNHYDEQSNLFNGDYFLDDEKATNKASNLDFATWFSLYTNEIKYNPIYEKEIDTVFK